jgi:hypothetical protein
MKKGQTKRPAVIGAGDRKALTEFPTRGGQWLPPLVELLERSAAAIDDVIDVAGRAMIGAVLQLSAGNVAGPKVQGQSARRDVCWYGSRLGEVVLSDRRLKVTRPRLRRRGVGAGGEVEIPAYARLREGGPGEHVVQLMMQGVSTRNHEPVLREMADTAGVSKMRIPTEAGHCGTVVLPTRVRRPRDKGDDSYCTSSARRSSAASWGTGICGCSSRR